MPEGIDLDTSLLFRLMRQKLRVRLEAARAKPPGVVPGKVSRFHQIFGKLLRPQETGRRGILQRAGPGAVRQPAQNRSNQNHREHDHPLDRRCRGHLLASLFDPIIARLPA